MIIIIITLFTEFEMKNNNLTKAISGLVFLAFLTTACATPTSVAQPTIADDDRIQVTVSILPQKYFVERVGGQDVAVNVMVGPGESPHSYEPKPEQMRALSESALYFLIGVEFEGAWMERIASANPDMRMVDLSAGIDKLPMAAHGHANDEEHKAEGDEHEEDENGLDPHVWTSPELVKGMAAVIARELAELNPQRADYYDANLDEFISDIESLQADIRASLNPLESRKFMVFHPSWGYFARDFGLEQVAIEVGGTEPSASQLAALLDEAREEGIQVVFAQPEFSTRSADTIAREIGGTVILISPLAEDWLDNLARVAGALADNLQSDYK